MDARTAIILSAKKAIDADSGLQALLRDNTQDVSDPSRVVHWPHIKLDFVTTRNLRGINREQIVVGELVFNVYTNRDQTPQTSGDGSGTVVMTDEYKIIARLAKVFAVDYPALSSQSGDGWTWTMSKIAPGDPPQFQRGAKEAHAVVAYAVSAVGTYS